MEVTPKASDVIEVVASPDRPITTTVTDPLPSAGKYSPEDLAALQEKIKMVKFLILAFHNFLNLPEMD